MRLRIRHINPKSAGALVAWDSRFIPNLSSGSAVSTWNDRSGGTTYDATQLVTTSKPTFQAQIQGGQPVVRFDGGDMLNHSLARSAAMTVMHVLKVTGGGTIQQSASFASAGSNFNCAFSPKAFSSTNSGTYVNSWISAGFTALDFAVYTMTDTATGSITFNKAGVAGNSYTGQSYYVDPLRDRKIIGGVAGLSEYFVGDYCLISMFPEVLSAPLQKRMQRSFSFSFKIPCS